MWLGLFVSETLDGETGILTTYHLPVSIARFQRYSAVHILYVSAADVALPKQPVVHSSATRAHRGGYMEIKIGDRTFELPENCTVEVPTRAMLLQHLREHGPESFLTSKKLSRFAGCVKDELLEETKNHTE